MRLEVVYRNSDDRERAYVLDDATEFILEANSLGDVTLRANAADPFGR